MNIYNVEADKVDVLEIERLAFITTGFVCLFLQKKRRQRLQPRTPILISPLSVDVKVHVVTTERSEISPLFIFLLE